MKTAEKDEGGRRKDVGPSAFNLPPSSFLYLLFFVAFIFSARGAEVSLPEGNFYRPGEYLQLLVKGPVKLSVGSFEMVVNSTDQQMVPVLVVGDGEQKLTWQGFSTQLRPATEQAKHFQLVQPELYESMPAGEVAGVRWRVAIFAGIYCILMIALLLLKRRALLVIAAICGLGLIHSWRQSLPPSVVTRQGDLTYVIPRAGRIAEFPWDEKVTPLFSSDHQPIQLDWDNRKFKFAQPTIFLRRGI